MILASVSEDSVCYWLTVAVSSGEKLNTVRNLNQRLWQERYSAYLLGPRVSKQTWHLIIIGQTSSAPLPLPETRKHVGHLQKGATYLWLEHIPIGATQSCSSPAPLANASTEWSSLYIHGNIFLQQHAKEVPIKPILKLLIDLKREIKIPKVWFLL